MITQEQYNVLFQNARELYIKVFILNNMNRIVAEVEGVVIDGSVTIDGTSTVRRNCDISLTVTDSSFSISNEGKIWLDKRVQIQIGLIDRSLNNIVWFDMGKFLINQPSLVYSATENTLSFSGLDLMCMFNGDRGGVLESKVVIEPSTPLHEAIKSTVQGLGKYQNVIVETSDRVVPYKIERQSGDTIWSILEELKDMFLDFEMYIDINGTFIYQRVRNKSNDPLSFDFSKAPLDLAIDYSKNYDFTNVKNKITVNGKLLNNGDLITYTAINTDTNSPFNINSSMGIIANVFNDEKIFTVDQARAKAEYELWRSSNSKEEIDINVVPIYSLDVNRSIYISNKQEDLEGKYLITKLNIPLNIDGNMSISCVRIYQ